MFQISYLINCFNDVRHIYICVLWCYLNLLVTDISNGMLTLFVGFYFVNLSIQKAIKNSIQIF